MILLPNTNLESAIMYAERIRKKPENTLIPEIPHKVTASFGITEFTDQDTDMTIIARVDYALYEAKKTGKNRCVARQGS